MQRVQRPPGPQATAPPAPLRRLWRPRCAQDGLSTALWNTPYSGGAAPKMGNTALLRRLEPSSEGCAGTSVIPCCLLVSYGPLAHDTAALSI